jgi:cation:H+ antiporter
MLIQILFLVIGFILLFKSADWLVKGSSALAKKMNVSDLAIGLTVVAFGTSTPELVVNIFASLDNRPDIVLGNIIGSNNFNIFIILGISALISPLVVQSSTVWKEIPISLLAVILLIFFANDFFFYQGFLLSRLDGLMLLILFIAFVYYVYSQLGNDTTNQVVSFHLYTTQKIIMLVIGGLLGLTFGGRLVVYSSIEIANLFNISEKIIGLTIIAAGTSLPELATSVVAALKRNNDIAVGNIIGSNIFNIFFILSVSILINPITFNTKFNLDISLLFLGTVVLFIAMFTGKKKKLERWEAIILLLLYLTYTVYLIRS